MLVRYAPQPREHHEQDWVDEDGVGNREERDRAGPEGKGRNRHESVGGIEVATHQEPGDEGSEPPAAEPPFVQQVEIASAPAGGNEPQPGDEAEQQDEDGQRHPIHFTHGLPPAM